MKANQTKGYIPVKPNAWVVNPSDKGRKAIKNNSKVYLQDGQNFEIELYNPLTESVLCDVKVNNSSVSKSGLVLRPGERFYLDCFIDSKKKFVFKTYEVENTEESKSAIQKNGIVEVFFYKEETIDLKDWRKTLEPMIERHYYPVYYPWYRPYYYPYYFGTTTTNLNNTGGAYTLTNGIVGTTTNTSNAYYSNIGDLTLNSSSDMGSISRNYTSNNIETGRIEKGDNSNQQFESVDMNFEKYHINSVIYQILPESQKPVETKEINKKSKKEKIKNLESQVEELKKMVEQLTKKS